MKTLFILTLALFCTFAFPQGAFTNPVIRGVNNPDPGVIYYEGAYYAVTTSRRFLTAYKFPIYKSTDLQNWNHVANVFPEDAIPSWSNVSLEFWAPELHIVNGKFRAVYTSREASSGLLCIGMATADNILGPYTDIGAPIIRNTTVGSIDATIVDLDNGTYYLVWKDDGNGLNPQIPTWIKAQELINDGVDVTGPVSYLIKNDLDWEGAVTEGPWIIKKGDYFYLFYSASGFCDESYCVGIARSQDLLGPYTKKPEPLLHSNSVWVGPGHCSVVQDAGNTGKWVMIYHSWIQGEVCGTNNRVMMADYIYWDNDQWPFMSTSSPTSQGNLAVGGFSVQSS